MSDAQWLARLRMELSQKLAGINHELEDAPSGFLIRGWRSVNERVPAMTIPSVEGPAFAIHALRIFLDSGSVVVTDVGLDGEEEILSFPRRTPEEAAETAVAELRKNLGL